MATSTQSHTAPELWKGTGPFCFTSTEARLRIRDGEGGGGGEGGESEGSTADTAPKTGETVDRRENNPLAIAQRLVRCAADCCFNHRAGQSHQDNVRAALLLRNNPKRKKSNFRSPAPPPCS